MLCVFYFVVSVFFKLLLLLFVYSGTIVASRIDIFTYCFVSYPQMTREYPQNKPLLKTLLAAGSRRQEPTWCSKACVQAVAPFSSSLSAEAGSCARWQPALLCWSKHKLLLSSVTGGNTGASPRLFQDNPRSGLQRRQAVKVSDMTTLVPSLRLLRLDTHLARRKRQHFSVILPQPHARRHTQTHAAVLLPVRYAQQRTETQRPFQVRLFLSFFLFFLTFL